MDRRDSQKIDDFYNEFGVQIDRYELYLRNLLGINKSIRHEFMNEVGRNTDHLDLIIQKYKVIVSFPR
jgi:hypothetical protein